MPTPSRSIDEAVLEADLVVTFRGKNAYIVKDREGPSSKGPISIEAALFRITQHRADLAASKKT